MRQMGRVADEFAGGKGHLTTRQNIQYHFVPLPRVADLLHMLADVRLTTREACYNTVRNVTACPLAGIHPEEPFDVQPYARRVAFAFLHKELTDSLPRKFKIAFAGCPEDCIATAINDVGLRAMIRDGVKGFRMTVAGGLGPLPTESKVLHEFIPADDLVRRIEAVIRVFNVHGNRKNKNKARLKFVLRERGFEWLRDTIEEQYQDILKNGGIAMPDASAGKLRRIQSAASAAGVGRFAAGVGAFVARSSPSGARPTCVAQKQKGYSIVTVTTPQGNLTGDQMRGLADIADQAGDGFLRFSMIQNVIFGWVPDGALKRVYGALAKLDLAEGGADEITDVITCPGAYSCNLGLTKTMGLGAGAAKRAWRIRPIPRSASCASTRAAARIPAASTGSPTSASTATRARSTGPEGGKKEVPYYQMLLGGTYQEFGVAVQSIPARLAPVAVGRVLEHFKAEPRGRRNLPRVRSAPQGGDVPPAHRGSDQAAAWTSPRCSATGATTSSTA